MRIQQSGTWDDTLAGLHVAESALTPPEASPVVLDKLEQHWPECQDLCWIATVDDTIVGACLGYRDGRDAFIAILGVHPDHHGTGLGTQLVTAFAEAAVRDGCGRVTAGVRPDARGFYTKLGFVGGAVMTKQLSGGALARYADDDARKKRLAELRAKRLDRATSVATHSPDLASETQA